MIFGVFWCFRKCYKKYFSLSSYEEHSVFPLRVNFSHHLKRLFSGTYYLRGMIENQQSKLAQLSALWKKTLIYRDNKTFTMAEKNISLNPCLFFSVFRFLFWDENSGWGKGWISIFRTFCNSALIMESDSSEDTWS